MSKNPLMPTLKVYAREKNHEKVTELANTIGMEDMLYEFAHPSTPLCPTLGVLITNNCLGDIPSAILSQIPGTAFTDKVMTLALKDGHIGSWPPKITKEILEKIAPQYKHSILSVSIQNNSFLKFPDINLEFMTGNSLFADDTPLGIALDMGCLQNFGPEILNLFPYSMLQTECGILKKLY